MDNNINYISATQSDEQPNYVQNNDSQNLAIKNIHIH